MEVEDDGEVERVGPYVVSPIVQSSQTEQDRRTEVEGETIYSAPRNYRCAGEGSS